VETIQKAANTVSGGTTAIVAPGKYDERVTVSNSGSSGNYIVERNDITMQMRSGLEEWKHLPQFQGSDAVDWRQPTRQERPHHGSAGLFSLLTARAKPSTASQEIK